jgi:hypothetical protein
MVRGNVVFGSILLKKSVLRNTDIHDESYRGVITEFCNQQDASASYLLFTMTAKGNFHAFPDQAATGSLGS